MKKFYFLIILALILGLVLSGCLLSNVGQVPTNDQSGITYLTKTVLLPDDLVGLWRFNNGNADDSSGYDNHGTVYGASYFSSPMGQALSFGGSDYVYVPDSDSLDITRATLEAWIKPSVSSQTGCARIVFKGTNSPFMPLYFLAYDGSGTRMRMVVFIGGCGLRKTAISATALTDTEKWYHIAGTYDGAEVKIYIDGFLEGTTSAPGDVDIDTGSEDLGIGRNTEINSYGYKGLIDEVRIWNFALSKDQLGKFIYDFGDILPPIKPDGSSVFKLGRTIPVKFQLWDDQGNLVTDAVANIFVKKISNYTSGEEIDAIYTTAATNGNLFRYDSESEQYIFNLSTKLPLNNGVSWSTGTWEIRIELDDGMSYCEHIILRP